MNTLNLFDTFDRAFNLNMNTIMNSRYKESDFNRLKEGDTEYSISLNLAGTNKSDIKVSFEKRRRYAFDKNGRRNALLLQGLHSKWC